MRAFRLRSVASSRRGIFRSGNSMENLLRGSPPRQKVPRGTFSGRRPSTAQMFHVKHHRPKPRKVRAQRMGVIRNPASGRLAGFGASLRPHPGPGGESLPIPKARHRSSDRDEILLPETTRPALLGREKGKSEPVPSPVAPRPSKAPTRILLEALVSAAKPPPTALLPPPPRAKRVPRLPAEENDTRPSAGRATAAGRKNAREQRESQESPHHCPDRGSGLASGLKPPPLLHFPG